MDSLRRCIENRIGPEDTTWFAANVVQRCTMTMSLAADKQFCEQLKYLVHDRRDAVAIIFKRNPYTARRIFNMCTDEEKVKIRRIVPQIDQFPCDSKVNHGFAASLFFHTWTALNASMEQPVTPNELATPQSYRFGKGWRIEMLIYGLPVYMHRANKRLGLLDLRKIII